MVNDCVLNQIILQQYIDVRCAMVPQNAQRKNVKPAPKRKLFPVPADLEEWTPLNFWGLQKICIMIYQGAAPDCLLTEVSKK